MTHPLYDVTAFEILDDTTLLVSFDDGTSQRIDLKPVLVGERFAPLQDPAFFRQVKLDPETKTLVWPNGADFDPYVLHEWPRAQEQLSLRLRGTTPLPVQS